MAIEIPFQSQSSTVSSRMVRAPLAKSFAHITTLSALFVLSVIFIFLIRLLIFNFFKETEHSIIYLVLFLITETQTQTQKNQFMKKISILLLVFFYLKSQANDECQMCGCKLERGRCPYEEQHHITMEQIESYIGYSDNGATRPVEMIGASGSLGIISMPNIYHQHKPLTTKTYSPQANTLESASFRSVVLRKKKWLKEQCQQYKEKGNVYQLGSNEWVEHWRMAYQFALSYSNDIHCLFFGVLALTKLQCYPQALQLLDFVAHYAYRLNDQSLIKAVNDQYWFINSCARIYAERNGD